MYRKNNRRIKAECRYGEVWGITSIPSCSWRAESDLQQGRLEAVRYSPRAAPTRLARPARLYGTTLVATSCYVSARHAQAPPGSRTHGGYVRVCQYVALSYFALSCLVTKRRYLSQGDLVGSTQTKALCSSWALSYSRAHAVDPFWSCVRYDALW